MTQPGLLRGNSPTGYVTGRQIEVWRMVASGFQDKQIAKHLGISYKTVSKHHQEVNRKLGVRNVCGLTRRAIECGVITVNITPLKMYQHGGRQFFVLP